MELLGAADKKHKEQTFIFNFSFSIRHWFSWKSKKKELRIEMEM